MSQIPPFFRLPDFLRTTWVSDRARDVWKPKLDAIRDAWPEVALGMVAGGLAKRALRALPPRLIFRLQAEAKRRGVAVAPLGVRGVAIPCYALESRLPILGKPFLYDAAFGTEEAVREMEMLWERCDYRAVYRLAGFPECCVAAFQQDIETRRIDSLGRLASSTSCLEVESGALVDPFWRWLNIERITCPPCSLHCAKAKEESLLWMDAAAYCGYRAEIDSLREVLSWPVEWSALHGIAELKTPILKAAGTTDTTNAKVLLRYRGEGYPHEGATGLGFPYRPSDKAALTSSSGFRRGLDNLIQIG